MAAAPAEEVCEPACPPPVPDPVPAPVEKDAALVAEAKPEVRDPTALETRDEAEEMRPEAEERAPVDERDVAEAEPEAEDPEPVEPPVAAAQREAKSADDERSASAEPVKRTGLTIGGVGLVETLATALHLLHGRRLAGAEADGGVASIIIDAGL